MRLIDIKKLSVIYCLLGVVIASGCASDDEQTEEPASEDANAASAEENAEAPSGRRS